MELILKLIVIISIFCFMCLAFRTNWREYKSYKEELILNGKLASPEIVTIRILRTTGIIFGIPLIITIIVIYVKGLEFSIQTLIGGTLILFAIESFIAGIGWIIQESIKTYKTKGLIVAIIAVILTISITAGILYVRYNW